MNNKFRFADWDPARGTVPAYFVGEDGLITAGEIIIGANGQPINKLGDALDDDESVQTLTGWAHTQCSSYAMGRVLVPLKSSRA
jgi:hypothetical protein